MASKVVVVGVSAVGKSTFARALAEKNKLPLTHMDEIMWRPGWEYIGDEVTNAKLRETSQGERWVIEGYVTRDSRTFLFAKANQIFYLDYSRWLCTWRYLKRWWKFRKEPRPELPGSPESFSFTFLWLVFTKGEAISLRKFLGEVEDQSKIVTLHSPKESNSLLETL